MPIPNRRRFLTGAAAAGAAGFAGILRRYGLWREYDPADAVRFFTLRLHEAGMIKLTPNDVIAEFTDWRFLNEFKREMKT